MRDMDHESQATDKRSKKKRSRSRRLARKGISVLPTMFTLGNLLCGFAAVYMASRRAEVGELPLNWSPLTFAAALIFLGMLLDGLDGRVARLTRSTSDLGEQLDSMADMVTFGVAPAFLAIQLVGVGIPFIGQTLEDSLFDRFALLVGLTYVACAALRLARFNIEHEDDSPDHSSFKGLPSPGAGGAVASLVLLHEHYFKHYGEESWTVSVAAGVMVGVMLAAAIGMVSTFRYSHVLNKYVGGRAPFAVVAYATIGFLLLLAYPQLVIAVGFSVYALSAPFMYYYDKIFRPEKAKEWIVDSLGGDNEDEDCD